MKYTPRQPTGSVFRSAANFPRPILQTLVIYTNSICRGKMTFLTYELAILTLALFLSTDVSACWVMVTAKLISYTSGKRYYNRQAFNNFMMVQVLPASCHVGVHVRSTTGQHICDYRVISPFYLLRPLSCNIWTTCCFKDLSLKKNPFIEWDSKIPIHWKGYEIWGLVGFQKSCTVCNGAEKCIWVPWLWANLWVVILKNKTIISPVSVFCSLKCD